MSEADDLFSATGPGSGGRDAKAQPIIDAIESVPTTDHFVRTNRKGATAGSTLPALDLPGFGETREDCGDEVPYACSSCGHTAIFGRTCYQSTCPRCGASWARKRATKAVAKLKAAQYEKWGQSTEDQYFHHVVISPPDYWAPEAEDGLDEGFDVCKSILDELGAVGLIAYHPYRGWHDDEGESDDRGQWKQRLFSGRDWEGDVKDELKPSPHFHCVVVSDFIKGGSLTERVEEETGWVIHRITGGNSSKSLADDEAMASAVTYTLSHVGLYETDAGNVRSATRWKWGQGLGRNGPEVYDETEDRADHLVRSVAHDTLGISSPGLSCNAAVGSAPDNDNEHSHDGEGSTSSTSGSSTSDSSREKADRCSGKMQNIAKVAARLTDETWLAHATNAQDLAQTWFAWEDELVGWLDNVDRIDPADVRIEVDARDEAPTPPPD